MSDPLTETKDGGETTCAGQRLPGAFWLIILAAFTVCFFWPSLFGHHSLVPTDVLHSFLLPRNPGSPIEVQNHYTADEVTQLYPAGHFWQQSVKRGELPLWNPWYFGGHPQLGTSMWGIFCPAKLFYLILSPERAYTVGLIAELFLAGLFMFYFLRELGRSPFASFMGACAYAFNSGFLMFYWLFLNVFAWVPLAFLLMERSFRRNSMPYAAVTGLAIAIAMVSGSVQMAVFVVCLTGLYSLASVRWTHAEMRWRDLQRITLIFGVAAFAGAIQFLPTLEFLSLQSFGMGNRRGAVAGIKQSLLGIPALVTFVFPALAGSPRTFDLLKYFDATMMFFTGYVGIVPFTLFLIGGQNVRDRKVRAFLLIIAFVLFIVFFTPLVRFLYHRFFTVGVFAMSAIVAYGADAIVSLDPEQRSRSRFSLRWMLILASAVLIGLLCVQVYIHEHAAALLAAGNRYIENSGAKNQFFAYPEWLYARVPRLLNHFKLSNPMFWVPMACIAGFGVVFRAYSRNTIGLRVLCSLVVALSLLDVFVLGRAWVPQVDLNQYPAYPPQPLFTVIRSDKELFRVERQMPRGFFLIQHNVLMAYDIAAVSGYESWAPENLETLPNRAGDGFNAVLDLQNAKYVLTTPTNTLPQERFELVGEQPGVRLYRNRTCLPRLQFVRQWQVIADRREILSRLASPSFDPRTMVFLEKEPEKPSSVPAQATPGAAESVEITHYGAQRITARASVSSGGIAVLADTWYPGWKARLDGRDVPLYRADYTLKAIYLPAGQHDIEFYYDPLSFKLGATITLVTIVFVFGWVAVSAWRQRLAAPTSEAPTTA
jgi:hypothetical protein